MLSLEPCQLLDYCYQLPKQSLAIIPLDSDCVQRYRIELSNNSNR